jgi:hypothetical protein
MELLVKLAIWMAPGLAVSAIWILWEWVVRRIFGGPRPKVVAILMFLTIAIPAMVFVIIFNMERASTASATN